jgi:hypothetical protein
MKPHKIRGVFSDDLLYPPDWIKEIVELSYDEKTIIDIISLYEFYIASIMRCTEFCHNLSNLSKKSRLIWEAYINKLQDNVNPIFTEMIKELNEFINSDNYGAGKNKINTINSYKIINDLTNYCFYSKNEKNRKTVKVRDKLLERKSYNVHSIELTKAIRIHCFSQDEYIEIIYLLDYFSRVKEKLNFDYEIKKTNYSLSTIENMKNEINIIQQNFNNQSNYFYDVKVNNTLIEIKELVKKNELGIDNIDKYFSQFEKKIKGYFERHLWISFSMNVNKLYMLAIYPRFLPVINTLIAHNYVEWRIPDHFIWKYKDIKNENLNEIDKGDQKKLCILAWLILDFVFLPTDKFDDYIKYCTPKRFEPFCIGFGEQNLHDNARKQDNKTPKGYRDLLREIGLKSNWDNYPNPTISPKSKKKENPTKKVIN